MKCSKCGTELIEGTKFCSECGEKVESERNENTLEMMKRISHSQSKMAYQAEKIEQEIDTEDTLNKQEELDYDGKEKINENNQETANDMFWFCPKCAKKNELEKNVCSNCNYIKHEKNPQNFNENKKTLNKFQSTIRKSPVISLIISLLGIILPFIVEFAFDSVLPDTVSGILVFLIFIDTIIAFIFAVTGIKKAIKVHKDWALSIIAMSIHSLWIISLTLLLSFYLFSSGYIEAFIFVFILMLIFIFGIAGDIIHCYLKNKKQEKIAWQELSYNQIYVEHEKKKNKTKPIAIISSIVCFVLVCVFTINIITINAIDGYKMDASRFSSKVASDSSILEDTGNDICENWYDSIYYDMFSSNAENAIKVARTQHITDLDNVEKNHDIITKDYTNLLKLPSDTEELQDIKENVKLTYDAYIDLYDCVINVNGSYVTFTSDFNAADTAFSKAYDKLVALVK